jgi:formylglycine-generating enzyme required for sulfatase activity
VGIICPALPGYDVACNPQQHCEYANKDQAGWKKWDVWIYVPPATFQMGSLPDEAGHEINEGPVHAVTFAEGYLIGKHEVVVAQYEACKAANAKCTAADTTDWPGTQGTNTSGGGKGEHPQNGLTWQQAKDFCAWVAPGGRLPSEAEWEYAATGPVHLKYPWGNSPDPTCSNNTAVFNEAGGAGGCGCGQGGTWKVGSKTAGAAWSGALDMAGNLWEWNEDWYHNTYTGSPADGSAWVDNGSYRVERGGCFNDEAVYYMRAAARAWTAPGNRYASVGARCVRPVPDCLPDCGGKQCGSDGCGGTCGNCPFSTSCQNGVCIPNCQANCAGKECGSDGCGGLCGSCGFGQTCVNGTCKSQ